MITRNSGIKYRHIQPFRKWLLTTAIPAVSIFKQNNSIILSFFSKALQTHWSKQSLVWWENLSNQHSARPVSTLVVVSFPSCRILYRAHVHGFLSKDNIDTLVWWHIHRQQDLYLTIGKTLEILRKHVKACRKIRTSEITLENPIHQTFWISFRFAGREIFVFNNSWYVLIQSL